MGDEVSSSQRKTSSVASEAEPKPTYRWVMLALSWLIYFSFGLISTTLSTVVTPVMNDLKITYSQMGFVLGVWPLMYIFIAQPMGLLIDRLGTYKTLLLGATIITASGVLRSFATNFETLTVFVALFGVGGSMISVGVPKLASIWFAGKERGTASGLYSTGFTVGGMTALLTTNSFLIPIVGDWRKVYLSYSFIGLLIALTWVFLGRRSPRLNESKATIKVKTDLKSLFRNRNIWLIVLIGITSFLTSHGLMNWLPKILELKGMTAAEAGLVSSFMNLIGIFGSILVPRLPYVVGSRKLAISMLLFLEGLGLLALSQASGVSLWLSVAFTGLITRGFMPMLMVTLMDLPEVGPERMGAVGGLYFAIGEIGGFGGPFVMGLLKDITGIFFSGIIFLVVVAEVSIVFAALLNVDTPRNKLRVNN
jgi:cyanate permease